MRVLWLCAIIALVGCRGCGDPPAEETEREEEEENNGVIVEPDESPDPVFSRECQTADCSCTIGEAGGFCRTPHCGVTVQPGTVEAETLFIVSERDADAAIAEDVIGARTCLVEPIDAEILKPFEVALYYDEGEVPDDFFEEEIVGAFVEPNFTLADRAVLEPELDRVSIAATERISYTASLLPDFVMLDQQLGLDSFEVEDAATFVRNLSRWEFSASWHDGTRFYVGNGPRVLVWNDGVPDDPTTPPDLLLGAPDLATRLDYASSSNFKSEVRAVWSDGEKLAVAEGHRVLIWNRIPTESYTPADLVLGQDDFTSYKANRDGMPAADTMASPMAIASDGERFVVAERSNNRYLVWSEFPSVNGQPADLVIGQPTLQENRANAGELATYDAWGAYLAGNRLALVSRFACECFQVLEPFPTESNPAVSWTVGHPSVLSRFDEQTFTQESSISGFGDDGVALQNGHRVSIWREFPKESVPADFTLGKPDATRGGQLGRISASSFASSSPFGHVATIPGGFVVGDGYRLLVWKELPTRSFEPADLVFGQPGFATNEKAIDFRGVTAETLAQPTSVSSAGDLTVIADRANNRVLVLDGELAEPKSVRVLGQADGLGFGPDRWGEAGRDTLDTPTSVYTDGTKIFVADSGNHRVLMWRSVPQRDGEPADLVLGQASGEGSEPNRGGEAGDDTLHYPGGITVNDGAIYVADTYNHRVLRWNIVPTTDGYPAQEILGQDDFGSTAPNRGAGWFARGADTLARPLDVEVDGSDVWVSDAQNNRVLRFPTFGPEASADLVLGQADFVSDATPSVIPSGVNIGFPYSEGSFVATADRLRNPAEIRLDGAGLWVADPGNHRVLRFSDFTDGAPADLVVGQPDFQTRASNEDSVTAGSLNAPEGLAFDKEGRLLVADTTNHRLLRFEDPPTSLAEASAIFGQNGFGRRGTNGSSPAITTLDGPGGLAFVDDTVWIADRRNHRVVAYREGEKVFTLGQFDAGGNLPNVGRDEPQGWTLNNPAAVWTDGTRLVVADRNNHRVLVWNELPTVGQEPADVIIGQPDRTSNAPNGGFPARAQADTLLAPEGVHVAGGKLYVADTGNNRVLVFDEFPTSDGSPASRVICQPDTTSNAPNRGGTPQAGTCANPTDILVNEDAIWIADAGNHRVLRFADNVATGANARQVLGQPDFESRAALEDGNLASARRLSNPVRLAFDGSSFFVVDRGNHRVLIWDGVPSADFQPADRLLGQVDFQTAVVTPDTEGLDSPFGIAVQPLPHHSARVWISDSGKNRVISFSRVARPF